MQLKGITSICSVEVDHIQHRSWQPDDLYSLPRARVLEPLDAAAKCRLVGADGTRGGHLLAAVQHQVLNGLVHCASKETPLISSEREPDDGAAFLQFRVAQSAVGVRAGAEAALVDLRGREPSPGVVVP